jgi:hypothetical protein
MLKNEQFEMYGQVLTGAETDLELAKLARKRYLKIKMRQGLAHEVGDDKDTITDVLRLALLCYGISSGIVTDTNAIARTNAYVAEMIMGYGGADNMLDILEFCRDAVGRHVVAGFFAAKVAIDAAETVDDVRMVDLPGDPGMT